MEGNLFVISGPSGVGKSTIRKNVIDSTDNIWYSISATTRPPRDGEINGVDYYFMSKNEFINNINNDDFIEYVEVYKDIFYGTLKDIVYDKLNKGINVIMEIDVVGALKVKEKFNKAVLIFIAPPSFDDLKERLISRNTDSLDKINERIDRANYELSLSNKYDYVVINDDLNSAVINIKNIINKKTH